MESSSDTSGGVVQSATSIMDAERALNVVAQAAQALSEEEKRDLLQFRYIAMICVAAETSRRNTV